MSDTRAIIGGEEGAGEQPLSFNDLGIPTGPQINDSILGKSRRLKDLEPVEILYVVLSVLSLLATCALSVYKMATVDTNDPDFTFALVVLVNSLFCSFYVVHGVLKERSYEIGIFMIAIIIILLYCITNYIVQVDRRGPVKLSRLIIVCVMSPVLIVISGCTGYGYYTSGNLIFRTIGANSELQSACKKLFMFLDILKLDLQLGISMVIFILNSGLKFDTEDIIILVAGGILSLVWFIMGHLSNRYESKPWTFIFILLSPAEPAYVLYKMVRSVQEAGGTEGDLIAATITAGCLALAVRAILMLLQYCVYRNYGKGLKEKELAIGQQRVG